MNDIQLWQLLLAKSTDDAVLSLLGELAELSLRERFAFFAAIEYLHTVDSPDLRRSAIAVVAGAGGHLALKHIVRALGDADAAVRQKAVISLAESTQQDQPRLAHALFHRLPDVRKHALAAIGDTSVAWYSLLLCEDEPNANEAKMAAINASHLFKQTSLPIIVGLAKKGSLTSEEAIEMIFQIRTDQWAVSSQPNQARSLQLVKQIATSFEHSDPTDSDPGSSFLGQVEITGTDILDTVVELLLRNASSPESSVCVKEWFRRLLDTSLKPGLKNDSVHHFVYRVWASMLRATKLLGEWTLPALEWAAICAENVLGDQSIPREQRRKAIGVLYQLRSKHQGLEAGIRKLLLSDLSRRKNGHLDLWAIGGLLHRVDKPYKMLLDTFTEKQVAAAFLADPADSALLFSLTDSGGVDRMALVDHIRGQRKSQSHLITAILIFSLNSDGFDFLSKLKPNDALMLFDQIHKLGIESAWKLANSRMRTAARYISPKLVRHVPQFLQTWFRQDLPYQNALGLEILGSLTAEVQGTDFAELVTGLSAVEIKTLIDIIPYCAGFSYGHELALAIKLQGSDDPSIREWATERVPTGETSVAKEVLPDSGTPLTPSEVKQIETATSRGQLHRALEPAIESSRSGVALALAGRAAPTTPDPTVCCALLGSSDPLRDVDAQFARFCGVDPDAKDLNKLEAKMVAQWAAKEDDIWMIGNAWLHRWEAHLFSFGEKTADEPETLCQILNLSRELTTSILREQIWAATHHLLQVYQARMKPRFLKLVKEDLLEICIDDLQTDVAPFAAKIIMMFHHHTTLWNLLSPHRDLVSQLSFDLSNEVRAILEPWISSKGVAGPATRRVLRKDLTKEERDEIRRCPDVDALLVWCRSNNGGTVYEATMRLIELGDAGQRALADLLQELPMVSGYSIIGESIALWDHQESIDMLRSVLDGDIVVDFGSPGADSQPSFHSRRQRVFTLGLAFIERGDRGLVDDVLAATQHDRNWFSGSDWSRLLHVVKPIERLVRGLITSPQPHAYRHAVEYALAQPHGEEVSIDCLRQFLLCGSKRHSTLRYQAAEWLFFSGDPIGLPIVIREFSAENKAVNICLGEMTFDTAKQLVDSALQVGGRTFAEKYLLSLISSSELDDDAKDYGYLQLSSLAKSESVQQYASHRLSPSSSRQAKLRKAAQVFHWGIQKGRELTGRLFGVSMIGGSSLGYTRMTDNRIYINPIPIFRGVQHSEDIVRGLVVHELGHHMYHRGEEEERIWDQAFDEGIGPLLNLVADEHLERNLRAIDDDYGNQLKRLGAYAFQHTKNEYSVETLLGIFRANSLDILSKTKLNVAREGASVSVESGRVLMEAERHGMSFPRFFRALRMGLGNRHRDPLVAKGLALFDKQFRNSTMQELYEITKKLRDIFESEACLIEAMNQDRMCANADRDLLCDGEGITDGELQSEIRRIERKEDLPDGGGRGAGGERCINVIPEVEFETISRVEPVAYSREAHKRYADLVRAPATRLRRFLTDLGSRYEAVPRRLQGSRLSRPLLKKLVIQRDPRVLVARERIIVNDLFLGVIVDCSGSMEYSSNLEKAKRFGMLVAEAARAVSGIDVRLFGFNDSTIFDAGSSERPAIPKLQTGGGNNDAAALWHAGQVALSSRRKAKLLVMISDGLPTECSVDALRALVLKLTHRFNICCAQASVEPLTEECFDHYVLLNENEIDTSVREFGSMIARLIRRAMQSAV